MNKPKLTEKTPVQLKPTDIQREDLWQFPMHYPIKIIGLEHDDFMSAVTQIILKQFPDFDVTTFEVKTSSGGKYRSISAQLYFEHKTHVNTLYADLAACHLIKTVL